MLAEAYHVHLGEEVTIRVLEEPPHTFTLVLPVVQEALLELSDAELGAVSGGYDARKPRTQTPLCHPSNFCTIHR